MDINHSIVVCPGVVTDGDHLIGTLDVDVLKALLVYWDKIQIISHSGAEVVIDSDLLFLKKRRIVSFTRIHLDFELSDGLTADYNGPTDASFRLFQGELLYDVALIKAFQSARQDKAGLWSYHELPWGIRLPPEQLKYAPAIELKLRNLLPVPAENVSFEDILNFKDSRRDDFNALQAAIYDLAYAAQQREEIEKGEFRAIVDLKKALAEWERVSNESRIMGALRRDLKISSVLTSAAVFSGLALTLNSAGCGELFKVPVELAAIVGGSFPLIEGIFVQRKEAIAALPKDVLSFKYASDVRNILL